MKTETYVDRVEAFFREDVGRFTCGLSALDNMIDPNEAPRHDDRFETLLDMLSEMRAACRQMELDLADGGGTLKSVQQRFRHAIAPWFDRSPMMNRAKTKPRGYAGDYMMLTAVYDGKPLSKGLAGYLDLFFLGTELGRAVPARMVALRDFLKVEISRRPTESSILNVACGPCQEYAHGFPSMQARGACVTCVDFDTEAIAYSQSTVVASRDDLPEFRFVRYNALRMKASKPFIEKYGKFDIVYSVGLCDYIPDKQLIAMLHGWGELLKPEGVLYVAFKDTEQYDKTDYQWLTDWYFFQRTEAECRDLFLKAGWRNDELSMTRDSTGIIMNYSAQAWTPSLRRIDDAHTVLGPMVSEESVAVE
jgi:extracellular factor (EF) 3-hydroxypalmitic acid methyl ester biosynthesis protein